MARIRRLASPRLSRRDVLAFGALALACAAVPESAAAVERRPPAGMRHFVEFRARHAAHLGHTYVIYGRVDRAGRIVEHHETGLIPEDESWKGLFIPILGSVRKYKDDMRLPVQARYWRWLTPAQYRRLVAKVRLMQATQRRWHAVFFNCNDFAIEIAETIGLWRPPSLMPPATWVNGLRILNGG